MTTLILSSVLILLAISLVSPQLYIKIKSRVKDVKETLSIILASSDKEMKEKKFAEIDARFEDLEYLEKRVEAVSELVSELVMTVSKLEANTKIKRIKV